MLIEINWKPDRRELRNFGWVMLICFPLFGALLSWRFASWSPLAVCAGLAIACWGAALFVPPVGMWIYKVWMAIGWAMGLVMAPVAIAIIYYVVVTPIAWFLRLTGKDPMQRKRRGADSYWLPVEHRSSPRSYQRQF